MHKKGLVRSKYRFWGGVLVKIDTDEPEIYGDMESVFVPIGNDLPHFFSNIFRLYKFTLQRIDFR